MTEIDSNLAKAGYVLIPNIETGIAVHNNFSRPQIIGPIPNPEEFSAGPDMRDHGFIAKQSGWDMCVVPATYRAFLPTLQVALDAEWAKGNGREKAFVIRASRHTADLGEPHQSQIPDWHTHKNEGPSTVYSAADVMGTNFRLNASAILVPRAKDAEEFQINLNIYQASAAPKNSIVRFDQNADHCTPQSETEEERRRTFFAVIAYEKDIPLGRYIMKRADQVQNPLRGYIAESRPDRAEILNAWRENTESYFAQLAAKNASLRQPEPAFAVVGCH